MVNLGNATSNAPQRPPLPTIPYPNYNSIHTKHTQPIHLQPQSTKDHTKSHNSPLQYGLDELPAILKPYQGPIYFSTGDPENGGTKQKRASSFSEFEDTPQNQLKFLEAPKKKKRRRTRIAKTDPGDLVCSRCGTNNTPKWRRGPKSNTKSQNKIFCNACGLREAKYTDDSKPIAQHPLSDSCAKPES